MLYQMCLNIQYIALQMPAAKHAEVITLIANGIIHSLIYISYNKNAPKQSNCGLTVQRQ